MVILYRGMIYKLFFQNLMFDYKLINRLGKCERFNMSLAV